jgi:hypothetical protein
MVLTHITIPRPLEAHTIPFCYSTFFAHYVRFGWTVVRSSDPSSSYALVALFLILQRYNWFTERMLTSRILSQARVGSLLFFGSEYGPFFPDVSTSAKSRSLNPVISMEQSPAFLFRLDVSVRRTLMDDDSACCHSPIYASF